MVRKTSEYETRPTAHGRKIAVRQSPLNHHRHLDDEVDQGVLQGEPEDLVVEHPRVVVPEWFGEVQPGAASGLQREDEGLDHRPEVHQGDQQRGGDQEDPAGEVAALLDPEPPPRGLGRFGARRLCSQE
jgi:hypothetical protein